MNTLLRISAWLLALALVALPVVAVLNGWVGAERWPLSRLRVTGQFERVEAAQLRAAVAPYARAGYFAVKLDEAQRAVERLPWVESAHVGKQWPDVLEVSVVEHRPFAHWGEDRMLSERGLLFPRPADLAGARLPHLDGPDARSADVVELYNECQALFAPLGYHVTYMAVDARGSWSLALDNGTEVLVGRDDARARLQRFVRVLPQLLAAQARPLDRADLRYTNGFTLAWGQPRTSSNPPALPRPLAARTRAAQASST
ncbi:cell division protein FtsQ [Pseudoxanthomonas suwonensis 11-1]|uniref:Cell division protein FtsQ n=1 Tax=Pseudoxanthomonas suwonensis (strain 11-1) TaxID=743721 RepID=E6WQQ0_PSEUU|nr:cell division protein FtsQ/DivIB [Pseudoxanthomonas suwonensis]ADV26499.1 cell division protein FtsQ [Pseudoxanthomonas suwonensis 11-1]